MLPKKSEEDLFKDSTMTFGEHLEELRRSLIRAILWLVGGVAIGLIFANHIVALIKLPLERALGAYYQEFGAKDYATWAATEEAAGRSVPYTVDEVNWLLTELGLIYEMRFMHPQVVEAIAENKPFIPLQLPVPDDKQTASSTTTDVPASPDSHLERESIDQRLHALGMKPVLFWQPIAKDQRTSIKGLKATEAFAIWMKAGLVGGIILSSPGVFYHLWSFVAAGLYPHEKKYVYVFLPFSLGLFLLGASLAFFFVFEPVLRFLFSFNRSLGIEIDPRISEWLSFVLFLPLGFGIAFQLPLVMLFLERIGIFDVSAYLANWRISVLVIFVLSAVLTPADPYSMVLLAIPLTFLFFGGVLLCKLWPRSDNPLTA